MQDALKPSNPKRVGEATTQPDVARATENTTTEPPSVVALHGSCKQGVTGPIAATFC